MSYGSQDRILPKYGKGRGRFRHVRQYFRICYLTIMVSGHHIRLIQVSNFLDLNIYAKTPWGPRVFIILSYIIILYCKLMYLGPVKTEMVDFH